MLPVWPAWLAFLWAGTVSVDARHSHERCQPFGHEEGLGRLARFLPKSLPKQMQPAPAVRGRSGLTDRASVPAVAAVSPLGINAKDHHMARWG